MGKRRNVKFRKIDLFMITIFVIMLLVTPVMIVFSNSVLSKTNIEVQKMQNKIERQETINESLLMKINELASLSNIQDIAREHGLSYNNENIIIIRDGE